MSEEREEVYQILELGKHLKNLHHKKGFGGLLFIDLSMIKFSKLSSYIRQLDKENEELKKQLEEKNKPQIFIDTQDMEERYAEGLYQDFLKEENKQLKDNWNKLKEWLKEYEEGTYGLGSYETGLSDGLGDVIKKMRELQGSDD